MTRARPCLAKATSLAVAPALAALLAAGCGGDGGPTEPDPDPLVLSVASGDGQTGPTGDSVPDPLVVEAEQGGSALSGEPVEWELAESPGSGGALASESTDTDSDGRAANRLALGPEEGDYRVRAVLTSGPDTVEFTATAEEPRVEQASRDSGDGQSGTVDQPLDDSLVVRVRDQFGDPLPEALVEFEVTRGASAGSVVDPDSARTDSTGRAGAVLTLGSKNGTYRVAAATTADTVTFDATASGGTEALLAVDSVRPQPLQAGGTASVFGAGFGDTPDDNDVVVDARSATVTAVTGSRLDIEVPVFTDECLPRRSVDVEVSTAGDSAGPVSGELEPSVDPLGLSAGEDTVLVGPDAVGCVQLAGSAPGDAEYEVMATTVPTTLGTQVMELSVNGNGPVGADAEGAAPAIDGRRVRTPAGAELPDWKLEQYEWDRRLREMERQWIDEIRARARRAPSMSRTVGLTTDVASVGDSATFIVSCTGEPEVRAVARTVSDAAVIYEDTVMASEGVGLTDAQYDSIATRFDTLSFAVDTTYFGAPADIDENGRILMLFTPAVNTLTDGDYDDGFVVGFFCGADLSGSNEAEMFYLVSPDPDGEFNGGGGSLNKNFVRSIIEGTVIHEFQHLINAQIGGGTGPTDSNTGGANVTWLNEGLSHLAEEVGGHEAAGLGPGQELTASELTADTDALNQFYRANFSNLSQYLASPHTGTGPVSDDANFRTRGAAWSFVRYLLDRFVPPGSEEELTRALVQSSVTDARGAVEDAVQTAAGQSVVFEDVLTDWGGMYPVEDRDDLGAPPRPGLELTSYRLRDVYGHPAFGSGGSYPLAPPGAVQEIDLDASATLDASLFTGTGRYVRLTSSSESAGTGVRLAGTDGDDLPTSVAPRLIIVRTK